MLACHAHGPHVELARKTSPNLLFKNKSYGILAVPVLQHDRAATPAQLHNSGFSSQGLSNFKQTVISEGSYYPGRRHGHNSRTENMTSTAWVAAKGSRLHHGLTYTRTGLIMVYAKSLDSSLAVRGAHCSASKGPALPSPCPSLPL